MSGFLYAVRIVAIEGKKPSRCYTGRSFAIRSIESIILYLALFSSECPPSTNWTRHQRLQLVRH